MNIKTVLFSVVLAALVLIQSHSYADTNKASEGGNAAAKGTPETWPNALHPKQDVKNVKPTPILSTHITPTAVSQTNISPTKIKPSDISPTDVEPTGINSTNTGSFADNAPAMKTIQMKTPSEEQAKKQAAREPSRTTGTVKTKKPAE